MTVHSDRPDRLPAVRWSAWPAAITHRSAPGRQAEDDPVTWWTRTASTPGPH
ncbi:MAG: hypothetical protein M0C28_45570 [Candidatus Moduliflexus flocculans]|nr:hypothetical protein [Candidatus Moduliflexus flocculans]